MHLFRLAFATSLALGSTFAMAQSLSISTDVPAAGSPQAPLGANCGSVVLSQSTSNTITTNNSVSCNSGGLHTDNSYFRAFSLASYPDGFDVCAVRFGIETATGAGGTQPVTVRVLSNTGGAFPAGARTEVGSVNLSLADQSQTVFEVPLTASVPAGAQLVVEVFTPNGQAAGNRFFIGSNADGQSAPSYLQAANCGVTNPTDTAAIGFPNMHIVMAAVGDPVVVDADVAAGLTVAPEPAVPGNSITYTATATNNGPGDAEDVSITLPLPAGTSFVSATPSAGGTCNAASPVVCSWSGITANAAVRTATIVATLAANVTSGFSATATVASITDDPTSANNTATAASTLAPSSDLLTTITASPATVAPGLAITFAGNVVNNGPSDAQNVQLTIALGAGVGFSSFSSSAGGSCTAPPLNASGSVVCTWAGATAPGASRSATVIGSSYERGTVGATASATSGSSDPSPGNNSATGSVTVATGGGITPPTFIPTASQYGLAFLAVLMGLLGFAAVRRQH